MYNCGQRRKWNRQQRVFKICCSFRHLQVVNMQLFAAVRAGIPAENSLKHAETHHWEVLIKNATEEKVDSVFCCSVKCSLNDFEEASGGFCCYSLFYLAKVYRLKRLSNDWSYNTQIHTFLLSCSAFHPSSLFLSRVSEFWRNRPWKCQIW